MSSILKDADIGAWRVQLFDYSLIITAFRATMLEARNFTGDALGPLQVLDEIICKGTDVTRRFGERRPDVNGQPHLASESKAMRCEVSGFRWRQSVRL